MVCSMAAAMTKACFSLYVRAGVLFGSWDRPETHKLRASQQGKADEGSEQLHFGRLRMDS